MPYALREAFSAFRRAPLLTALSVVAIAFSLLVVGLFGLTAFNIHLAITGVEERVEVVAYLRDSASEAQVGIAREEIAAMPEVSELRYVSKTEALATAMRELSEFRDLFLDMEANPLPASIEVRLRPGSRDPTTVEALAETLAAYPFVEDVRFGQEWLERIFVLRRIAGGVALVIGGAFAAVAAIIIGSAVRVAVFARRDEISIMRLVGATDGFIRLPFLLEGLITGILGGAVAVGLTFLAYRIVSVALIEVAWIPVEWVLLGVLAGTALGFAASALAVRRHLRAV